MDVNGTYDMVLCLFTGLAYLLYILSALYVFASDLGTRDTKYEKDAERFVSQVCIVLAFICVILILLDLYKSEGQVWASYLIVGISLIVVLTAAYNKVVGRRYWSDDSSDEIEQKELQ